MQMKKKIKETETLIFNLYFQAFKGTIKNRSFRSLHEESLERTLTVPLNLDFLDC